MVYLDVMVVQVACLSGHVVTVLAVQWCHLGGAPENVHV